MEQAGVALIAAGGDVYISTMSQATKATNTFVDATDKGAGKVSAAGQVMIGGLRKVGEFVVDSFAQATKATAVFLKDSVDLAGDFEQGMREFQSVAGKDVDTSGLERFKDLFIDIGKDLPVSTTEVQQAATEMVKGGIDPAIIAAGGLRQNIQFAAAAMKGDLVGAAEISAKILGGWGEAGATAAEQADFLTHSTDLLTKAANASTVDVKELSLGIFNAQGIAKVAGVKFDDLTTTLAALSPRFESASVAGNSLKNMIARLQPTTDPATAAMEGLGLITAEGNNQFYDAKGNFVGMSKAGQLLQESMRGLTKQQQASVLQTIFGNDAMGAAAGLAELGAAGYAEMTTKMEKANGVAASAALIQGSFNTKLDNAKGSVEALQITLGTGLLPVLGKLLDDYITPSINAVTDFADRILGASDPVLAFASALHQWDAPLGSIAFYLTEVARGGEGVDAWLKETPPLFQGLIGGIQGTVKEFSRLSDAFSQGGLSGLIDTLLGDIGAALPDIKTQLGEWGSALGTWILDALPDVLGNFAELRGKMMAWVAESLPEWGDKLAEFAKPAAQWVLDAIPKLLDNLGDFAKKMIDQTLTYLPRWGATLVEFGVKAVSWIGEKLPALGEELGKFYNGMVNWVVDSLPKWGQELATFGEKSIGWVLDALPGLGTNLGKFAGSMLAWILQTTIDVTPKLATMALEFVTWVGTSVLPKLPGALLTIGTAIYNFIGEVGKEVVPKLATMAIGFTNWVATDVLPKLPGVMATIKSSIDTWIADTARWVLDQTVKIGTQLVAGIKEGVSNAWDSFIDWLVDKAGDALDAIFETWGIESPATEWMPAGEFAVEGIMAGFSAMWPQLTALVSNLSDDLIDQVKDIGNEINGIIADSFGATASIDRQIAANIGKMKDLLPGHQEYTKSILQEAQKQAEAFADPVQGAKFFKMRSDQIFELAKLDKEYSEAKDDAERKRIGEQMVAIRYAQQAELKQFDATPKSNPMQDLIDQFNQLFNNERKAKLEEEYAKAKTDAERARIQKELEAAAIPINDTGLGHDLKVMINRLAAIWGIPGLARGGLARKGQPYWVGEQGPELFWPQMNGMVSPAASSQQMAARANVTNYYGNVGPQVQMPIYTNNSPGALQQSWAIVQASMP